jgi:predicted nucleic acid binding AN1-type Zn finger protein
MNPLPDKLAEGTLAGTSYAYHNKHKPKHNDEWRFCSQCGGDGGATGDCPKCGGTGWAPRD